MKTASVRLLDRVSKAQANCSDYRIAQLLGVSRQAVSRWRCGGGHMDASLVVRACTLIGEKDVFRWEAAVGAEREKGPAGDFYRKVVMEFSRLDRGERAQPDWYLFPYTEGLRRIVAVILIALLGASGAVIPEVSRAASLDQSIHYAKSRRRRKPDLFAIA